MKFDFEINGTNIRRLRNGFEMIDGYLFRSPVSDRWQDSLVSSLIHEIKSRHDPIGSDPSLEEELAYLRGILDGTIKDD